MLSKEEATLCAAACKTCSQEDRIREIELTVARLGLVMESFESSVGKLDTIINRMTIVETNHNHHYESLQDLESRYAKTIERVFDDISATRATIESISKTIDATRNRFLGIVAAVSTIAALTGLAVQIIPMNL